MGKTEKKRQSAIPAMSASFVLGKLEERHARDVFVAECKNGATWDAAYRRLDAWAMPKSWSPWRTIGYEIKVSRQDFERDDKWPEYKQVCHELYFVCPAGLISVDDLPSTIGLIWASAAGRLHVKRKAQPSAPDASALSKLMAYVLMSRARIVGDMHQANGEREPPPADKLERLALLEREVKMAEERKRVATIVSAHVRARVMDADARADAAEEKAEAVENIVQSLEALGVRFDPHLSQWSVERSAINAVKNALGVSDLRRLADEIGSASKALARTGENLRQALGEAGIDVD